MKSIWLLSGLLAVLLGVRATWTLAAESPAQATESAPSATELTRREIELSTEFALLKDWVETHQKRALLARATNAVPKADWESALAQELSEQASKTVAQLETITRQRLALDQTNAMPKTGVAFSTDETAYVTKLRGMLWSLERDLMSLVETGRVLTVEFQTNTVPEELDRVSGLMLQNNEAMRLIEKERLNLELEELRFRILKNR